MKKASPKFEPFEGIMVVWRDTSGSGSWQSLHEPWPEPPVVEQLGFFIEEDKDTLRMCAGVPNREAGDCQVLAPTAIPKGCILTVRRVKVVKT